MTSHDYDRWNDAQGQNDTDDGCDLLAEAESLAEFNREVEAWDDTFYADPTDDELDEMFAHERSGLVFHDDPFGDDDFPDSDLSDDDAALIDLQGFVALPAA